MLVFILQFKPVQTYIAQKAAAYLSKELKTTIKIKSLYLKPFKSIVVEEFIVLDLEKDTLGNFKELSLDLNKLSTKERILNVANIQINEGNFYLKNYPNKTSNLDFIINYFDSGAPTTTDKPKFVFLVDKVVLNNFNFKYKNLARTVPVSGINFDDIFVQNLNGVFENISTKKHIVEGRIKNLSFLEKSGFALNNLRTDAILDTNVIELKSLLLETKTTRLSEYLSLNFKQFKDLSEFVTKVQLKANFTNSKIDAQDIAYFAPSLKDMKLILEVDGQVNGLVNNLKARQLSLKAGQSTFIKGNFNVKGLPNLEQTFMDLKVDLAGTNKKDLDRILKDVTGNTSSTIPAMVEKFGNVNFSGSFTGFTNDFVAYGEFKTGIGRVLTDVNMKMPKEGLPTYTGEVTTYDFNMGYLLDQPNLGKISANFNVVGKGFKLEELSEDLEGHIAYVDFNKYRYHNLNVEGTFIQKTFNGEVTINDPNVDLLFKGSVNLNPKLPVFQFDATIQGADLRALNFVKDSIKVDAVFSTNFAGNNLNNIEGELIVNQIRLENPEGIYHVDSVQLRASGTGIERSLTINSDILEASIKGQYDLNTIVSYYKAIAKTYIPSLDTQVFTYNPQIFNINIKVKNFDPVAQFFAPGLKIEKDAILIGNFDSRNNIATLNGYFEKVSYKGIVANEIIFDENTTDNQIQASITSERVDINDSLFIKNVNIVNVLRNDSLALNIKLSNSNDANQLDLNGLVEFAKDTTARISILPSNLTINNDEWSIQEKVRISFNEGKTEIINFDLSNGKQKITIDGAISKNETDQLLLGFENFELENINPFVKSLGFNLGGRLNGQTTLYHILASPKISDNLKIDSLNINEVYIGTLTDASLYDQSLNRADVLTKIIYEGKETFNLAGKLDLKEKAIDLDLNMNESKLAILAPFTSNLISNLKGFISSNIKVNGSFSKPQINGNISLKESELTVNYLKTPYRITDEIAIDNSVIKISDLVLNDIEGNEAVANGFVDLQNLQTPNIQVGLVAQNFMALNTTNKDNSTFYGRAYASGEFSFVGPPSNMVININAKAEKGTVFNLPLNSNGTVSDKDFITFISKDTNFVVEKKNNFEGLKLNFKLQVDPNSVANIYTALGKLSGRGNAELDLNISSTGDFEMKGDYVIESGSFDFTAQEVINKRFEIRQGGTIRWTGNPANAQINLKAVYALRASLDDLFSAANRENSAYANQRVETEVEMGLSGLLLTPKIDLDIFFPNSPAIKEELATYFNDINNMNKQALSLIIQRRFAPGASGRENIAQQIQDAGTQTASELIFNQLNSVLSSLNLNFVDLNIRSINEASASIKLFNDRVIINAGIMENANSNRLIDFNSSTVGREVEILALIKKDGTFVGKIANKPPTQQSVFANPGVNQGQNVTSVGLIYNQQFDNFKEFLDKITGKYRREQQRKEQELERLRINRETILQESSKKGQRK
ncbi:MAG: translocation/assembly module TamB [Pedobacter sp.]|nr:MAG: translocation/assembly module TamB [Pedobacter sp.]